MIIKIKYLDFFAFAPKSFRELLLLIINFLFIFSYQSFYRTLPTRLASRYGMNRNTLIF